MFLVEHYRPGLSVDLLGKAVADVREAAADLAAAGRTVAYLRSTIVPSDEAYITLFRAATEDEIRAAYALAGVPFARVSRAIAVEPETKE